MKTVKQLLGVCLVSLFSYSAMATNNVSEVKLNHKISRMLNTFENENFIVGIAVLNYSISEDGVIKVLNVEGTDEGVIKYVYSHLDGKTIKLKEGITAGEHALKVAFKSGL